MPAGDEDFLASRHQDDGIARPAGLGIAQVAECVEAEAIDSECHSGIVGRLVDEADAEHFASAKRYERQAILGARRAWLVFAAGLRRGPNLDRIRAVPAGRDPRTLNLGSWLVETLLQCDVALRGGQVRGKLGRGAEQCRQDRFAEDTAAEREQDLAGSIGDRALDSSSE